MNPSIFEKDLDQILSFETRASLNNSIIYGVFEIQKEDLNQGLVEISSGLVTFGVTATTANQVSLGTQIVIKNKNFTVVSKEIVDEFFTNLILKLK